MDVKIGKRTIPLFYSTYEMISIQKEIGCTSFQLKDAVFGIEQKDEDDPNSIVFGCVTDTEKTEKMCRLIRILGNAGLEENGEEPDLTDKWVMRHMRPGLILPYAVATMVEMVDGNKMETPKKETENVPVDEGLEEIRSKKSPGS